MLTTLLLYRRSLYIVLCLFHFMHISCVYDLLAWLHFWHGFNLYDVIVHATKFHFIFYFWL